MLHHTCIDPNDPYAQAEVLVRFEMTAGVVRLVSAHDATDNDILPHLEDVQRRALRAEILDDYREDLRTTNGSPRLGPIPADHAVNPQDRP